METIFWRRELKDANQKLNALELHAAKTKKVTAKPLSHRRWTYRPVLGPLRFCARAYRATLSSPEDRPNWLRRRSQQPEDAGWR